MMTIERNPYLELLALLSYEDLLRLGRRAQLRQNPWMVELLAAEIHRRDQIRHPS